MEDDKSITNVRSEKQELALALMMQGLTDTQIARELGVTRQTLYNWRHLDGQFMDALEERKSMLRDLAQESLLELTGDAIQAIRDSLASTDERIRLQAARLVLGMTKTEKQEEGKGSVVLELLAEAIEGIKPQLGLE